jgi:MFS family permease
VSTSYLSRDARLILAAQMLRAFAYGFGAVLIGVTLRDRHYSSAQVGLVLAAVVAGTALVSVLIARYGDRVGRRRCYITLYLLLAVTGVVFAFAAQFWLLVIVGLAGALSTEVVESGPFTSLEQVMLATDLHGRERLRGFGVYNAVATAAGALGALCAGLPDLVRSIWAGAPADATWFLLFVPASLAGAAVAASLSADVEAPSHRGEAPRETIDRSRRTVWHLSGLFALDSFGGGFVVQAFIAYWLSVRYGASVGTLGLIFFGVALLQTGSFLAAPRLAERFGILRTMVFTHLPSNVLLVLIPLAPNLIGAVLLLFARTVLSQMDVPTRQAYVMALVDPEERTAAAAYTNTARYVTRPIGPALAGVVQSIALGAPFVLAGSIKGIYDVALWRWFSHVPLPEERELVATPETAAVT